MIHAEGLQHIANLINGKAISAPLYLHLIAPDFNGNSITRLDGTWVVSEDGYMQHPAVTYTLHEKKTVAVEGCWLAFEDGTKLVTELFDLPRFLFYSEDTVKITPRYKIIEIIGQQ